VSEQLQDEQANRTAIRALVDVLRLEVIDDDLFRGHSEDNGRGRAFGGQVAAQALMAGMHSVPEDFFVHSMHSYFLLPGDPTGSIVSDGVRIRDGRSFLTRRVVARQHGRPIYYQTLNFQLPEEGYEHQDAMPEVGAPETGVDLVDVMRQGGNAEADALGKEWGALDVRWLGNTRFGLDPDDGHVSQARMWIRLREGLPDDPAIHAAAFTYASDVSLLGSTLSVHDVNPAKIQMASLDHTLWFHRPFRADEWWLYDQWSPSAQGARGLAFGRIFTADGALVVTAAQEGLIRPRRPDSEGPGAKE
jgi:acyl-CoA thioesterase-2